MLRLPSHQEGNVMLRAMIFNRSVLVLMIVSLPTSMAAAGPIFTHPIQPAGASPWVQGSRGDTMALLSGSSGELAGGVPWVDVRPSRLETLLTPTPVAAASGAVNPPTVPTVAVPASSSSPGEDSAASSQAGILSVSTSASPQAIDASGREPSMVRARREHRRLHRVGESPRARPRCPRGLSRRTRPRRPASPITDRPA